MEDAQCTDRTLSIYRTLRREHPGRVGVVLQARLRRTIDDVSALADEPVNFRLCKGIYLEPRSIAHTDPEIIRSNFTWTLESDVRAQGATSGSPRTTSGWSRARADRSASAARARGVRVPDAARRDDELGDELVRDGHRLRVYVPFGAQWYEYSLRRLQENPRIAGYVAADVLRQLRPGRPRERRRSEERPHRSRRHGPARRAGAGVEGEGVGSSRRESRTLT